MRPTFTQEQLEAAKLSYEDIGRSLAALVLEHNQKPEQVWSLVSDLGLYQRWELDLWLQMHRRNRRSALQDLEAKQKRREARKAALEAAKPRKVLKALRKSTNG
jgi:hypothetical protein